MTLSDLTRLATVANQRLDSPERADARQHLPMMVLAYIDARREAEKSATPRQREVLAFWEAYRGKHQSYPTLQEAADELGVAKVTVFGFVSALVDRGLMTRAPDTTRNYALVR